MRFPGSDNPVYQITLRQLQPRPKRRGWRWLLANGLYIFMLAVALIVYFGQWAGLLLWRDAYPIVRGLGSLLPLLMLYAIFSHIGNLLRILLLAANLISSMRTTAAWDLLVLTGIPARRIVGGMWWAVLRATLVDWLRLLPLRVGAVTYLAVSLTYPTGIITYGTPMSYRSSGLNLVPPSPLGLLLIVPLSLGLSLFAGALVASLGLFASAVVKRASAALAIAATLLVVLLGAGLLVSAVVHRVSLVVFPPSNFGATALYAGLTEVNNALVLSWFDNGGAFSSTLIQYGTTRGPVELTTLWSLFRSGNRTGFTLSAFGMSAALIVTILTLLNRLFLRLARWAVVRAGALPSPV